MPKNNNGKKAATIEELLSCFNNTLNNDSINYIKIFISIPNNSKPDMLLEWTSEEMEMSFLRIFSMGHAFLKLCQINNGRSIEKYLGFYPDRKVKAFFIRTFIKGKIVDDADHKFNASLIMYLTNDQFQKTLLRIKSMAGIIKYNYLEYNCTNFVLDIFNSIRPLNRILEIPKPYIKLGKRKCIINCNTPLGLFKKLENMKKTNDSESNNIVIRTN